MAAVKTDSPKDDYASAIGRSETTSDIISADQVQALAKTLDLDLDLRDGAALPPGWHWLFFNPFVKRSQLGPDGHPRRGGFLPDVALPRRMWAGSRLSYSEPIVIGAAAERKSTISDAVEKRGKMGRLVFVTVRHTIACDGKTCLFEEQDIVYREAPTPGFAAPRPEAAPENATHSEEVTPDTVMLFRYSALTSNGHRIHYDQPYARIEEGYRDLVVHGPLIATLLQGFAQRCRPEMPLASFDFRGTAPLFVDRPFSLEAAPSEDGLALWARGPEGELVMRAEARFSPSERGA